MRADRSGISRAYRTVVRALNDNLEDFWAVTEALDTLKLSVETVLTKFYDKAVLIGAAQAQRDLKILNLGDYNEPDPNTVPTAVTSTMLGVEYQCSKARSIAALDLGDELIVGDATRQGVIRPGPTLGEAAFWLTALSVITYENGVKGKIPDMRRQAVAQIDDHTTPCCLAVHGQIVKESEQFHLTAPPKYASDMDAPPFHRGCRTAVISIPVQDLKPEVTKEMREEAVAQSKKPKESTMKGRAHYRVYGKSVREFRAGRWHKFAEYDTILEARKAAARLNKERRS